MATWEEIICWGFIKELVTYLHNLSLWQFLGRVNVWEWLLTLSSQSWKLLSSHRRVLHFDVLRAIFSILFRLKTSSTTHSMSKEMQPLLGKVQLFWQLWVFMRGMMMLMSWWFFAGSSKCFNKWKIPALRSKGFYLMPCPFATIKFNQ